jgi:hypothetical protein
MTYVTGHNSLAPKSAKKAPNSRCYDGKLVIVVKRPGPAGHVAGVEDLLRSSHEFRECHAGS